jgi:hypothetical protein
MCFMSACSRGWLVQFRQVNGDAWATSWELATRHHNSVAGDLRKALLHNDAMHRRLQLGSSAPFGISDALLGRLWLDVRRAA